MEEAIKQIGERLKGLREVLDIPAEVKSPSLVSGVVRPPGEESVGVQETLEVHPRTLVEGTVRLCHVEDVLPVE